LPAAERSSDAKSVLERRDAIDAATIVRVSWTGDLVKMTGCEGSLLGSESTPF